MNRPQRTYLDHAATSWPKSQAVLAAVDHYANQTGAAAGRGSYRSADRASEIIRKARQSIAQLIGADSGNCISFHSNGTTAINAAIFGMVSAGDHLITTAADHNSVLRPLHHLQKNNQVELTVVPCDRYGQVAVQDIFDALRDDTRMVIMSHASNVTGAVQNVRAVGQRLAESTTIFAIDAAQTAGYVSIDVQELACDLLACPGHKGIAGPLGTGCLYVNQRWHGVIRPTIFGGTGHQSESLEMPATYPGKLEAGNLNVPAIAGLSIAAEELLKTDFAKRSSRLADIAKQLHQGLTNIDGLALHSQAGSLAIASLSVQNWLAADIAAILDVEFAIETRAGFHCAALIQSFLGDPPGGTLRISAGPSTTDDEIRLVVQAIQSIVASTV